MRFIRNIFAILLIPVISVSGYILAKDFLYFTVLYGDRYVLFWIGILSYIIFHMLIYRPTKIYVFGHELSHILIGILSGAKIKKFSINRKSGSVVLTKDNIWITLAPYFFPIYTFVLIIIHIFLGWFVNVEQIYGYFLFLIGFSIAFHIAFTVYILYIKQPDLKIYGRFFSYTIILTANIAIFTLFMLLVFQYKINIKDICLKMLKNTIAVYKFIYIGALDIWLTFQKMK
ncbi:MAG: hypothetical protein LBJ68_01475 [Endomicrobium sp.]|jgi:hypothetical protein|nr:hypothetical protein [Endomicrobium sp.]